MSRSRRPQETTEPARGPDGSAAEADTAGLDFIRAIVTEDVAAGVHDGRVATRFPPEPNGLLHIGHATAICLDFGIAEEFGGTCNLRFDDTNPTTEDVRYVDAIQEDIRWLGFEWDELRYASDYFAQLYEWAEDLVRDGKAYVDSLSEEEIREHRGTVTEPGRDSPHRERPVEENLELLRRMRAGEFGDGEHVLRAKIDMAHPNMKMRDPLLYRIRHAHHYRTGDDWCIYPMYDFAHPLSDAIERITHSLCTLEFENNRAVYDWLVEHVDTPGEPRQYEFARLNLDYTVMSKRKLLRLVEEGHVHGWDDPRMPTLAGLRRRGFTPESIRSFCDLIGIAKANSRVDMGKLEYAIREDLNVRAPRVMCVLDPLKVVITTWPAGETDEIDAPHFPHDVGKEGSRPVPFGREIWIERADFMEDPPPRYHRLAPGREVRLRYGYIIRCDEVVHGDDGEVVELRCSHDPGSRGGAAPDGRKIKGTIHWVAADAAVPVQVRLYDRLFRVANPDDVPEGGDLADHLNPDSLQVVEAALAEPALGDAAAGDHHQFERLGYFFADPVESSPGAPVFNRIVTLRDTWARIVAGAGAESAAGEDGTGEGEGRRGAAEARRGAEGSEGSKGAGRREDREGAEGDDGREGPAGGAGPTRAELRAAERAADPELRARYERYREELGVAEEDADVIAGDAGLTRLFEGALEAHADAPEVAKWIVNRVLGEIGDEPVNELPLSGRQVGDLVALVADDTITAAVAQELLQEMAREGGDPRRMVEERGLRQIGDEEELAPVVDGVLGAHTDEVAAYHEGRTGLLGFFIGQVMQRTGGQADPGTVRRLLQERLDA